MGIGTSYVATAQIVVAADLNQWARKMHESILMVGLTDSSASAAISDFSTLPAPPAANSASGFKVYEFNDALQASLPIYLKIEWGTGVTAATPGIWLSVGTTFDGVSNVTGSLPFMSRKQLTNAATTTNACQFFTGGSGSYLSATGPTRNLETQADGPNTFTFSVERFKNADGTDNAGGAVIAYSTTRTTFAFLTMPATGSIPTAETIWPAMIGSVDPNTQDGRGIVSPLYPIPALSQNPMLGFLVSQDSNFRDLDIIPIEVYPGVRATYVKLTPNCAGTVAGVSTAIALIRWT
jgi:hypothetical protein